MTMQDPLPRISVSPIDPALSILDQAIAYGRDGLLVTFVNAPVFGDNREPSELTPQATSCTCRMSRHCPEKTRGKHPVHEGWQSHASADESKLREQFSRIKFPTPNVGLVAGAQPSGAYLIVIDIDDAERFGELVAELGPLPETARCDSGRGYRLLYEKPAEMSAELLKNVNGIGGKRGVDAKAERGMFVVAPSMHYLGKRYEWTKTGPIAVLPMSWAQKLIKHAIPEWAPKTTPQSVSANPKEKQRALKYLDAAIRGEHVALSSCREGNRNTFLNDSACRLFSLCAGINLASAWGRVRDSLLDAAKACGLTEIESHKTLDSAQNFVLRSGAVRFPVSLADPPRTNPRMVKPTNGAAAHGEHAADSEQQTTEQDEKFADFVQPEEDPFERTVKLYEDHGSPTEMAANVALILAKHPMWNGGPFFDTYSQTEIWPDPLPDPIANLYRCEREIVDADHAAIQEWIMALPFEYRVRVGVGAVKDGIHLASSRKSVDLLQQWVENLPAWDGVPRIDTWTCVYLGLKDERYARLTGRAWLVSVMERAIRPGIVVDVIPILEGKQGLGKNRALETLFAGGPAWAPWITNIAGHKLDKEETLRLACTRWILHDDELRARDPARLDALKAWASRTRETYRIPYAKEITVSKRRGLLITSTNLDAYLHDDTGNRRWWPWQTDKIQIDLLARDQLQILAEALLAAKTPRDKSRPLAWQDCLDSDFHTQALEESDKRRVRDPIIQQLQRALTIGSFEGRAKPIDAEMTTHNLAKCLGFGIEHINKSLETRIGAAMRELGYKTERLSVGNERVRVYVPNLTLA